MTANIPNGPLFQGADDLQTTKKSRPGVAQQEASAGMLVALGGNAYRGVYLLLRALFRRIGRRR
jgi:hypothetical protein